MQKLKSHHRKNKASLLREKRMVFLLATASALILGFLVWISA